MSVTPQTARAAALAEGVEIFGAGAFARDLARALRAEGVTVHALRTSQNPARDEIDDLPVRPLDVPMPEGRPLWIGVFNRERHSDFRHLSALLRARQPGAQLVWPQVAYGWLAPRLGFRFWLHECGDYGSVAPLANAARDLLDDQSSRQAFDRIIEFRSQPSKHDHPPEAEAGPQYLPDWLRDHLVAQPRPMLRVVDGGAYRGETLRELATRMPVEHAWTFEPDPQNYAALVDALSDGSTSATHLPAGLSDTCGTALFSTGQGEASHLGAAPGGEPGMERVPLVSLDACLPGADVNFLKLDVEGHELAALKGASRTIARCRPTLAISAYHRWDDLWTLPAYIAGLGLGYRFRLGLHAHNSFDTVLYAF